MERIKAQLNDGRVDLAVAGLKPHRHRDEAVEACVRYMAANKGRMRYDVYRKRGLPVGSGVVESACSGSSEAGSSGRDATGRRRAPTPCSPSNAASTTPAGPTSSIGGPAETQLPDPKIWAAPNLRIPLAKICKMRQDSADFDWMPTDFGMQEVIEPRPLPDARSGADTPAVLIRKMLGRGGDGMHSRRREFQCIMDSTAHVTPGLSWDACLPVVMPGAGRSRENAGHNPSWAL